jgi:hypothetical protein
MIAIPQAAQLGEASSWPICTTSISEAVMGETLIGVVLKLGIPPVLCRLAVDASFVTIPGRLV